MFLMFLFYALTAVVDSYIRMFGYLLLTVCLAGPLCGMCLFILGNVLLGMLEDCH